MAVWQRGQTADVELQTLKPSTKHTLMVPNALHNLYPTNINPVPSETMFANPVDKTWFMKPDDSACKKQAQATDMAFFLLRQDASSKPSWTVFNESVSTEDTEQTTGGYLPIILAPAH
jgi:hypothetical protein